MGEIAGNKKTPKTRFERARWALFTALALAVVASRIVVGPASAHHPEVSGQANCSGLVTFTAEAWAGTGGADHIPSRTNSSIGVDYSTNGGSTFTALTQKPAYQFNQANNFEFSDSFQLPTPLPSSVIVRVKALADWGNGSPKGDTRQTTINVPAPCAGEPEASIANATCADDGALVTMKNNGGASVTFTITKNGGSPVTVDVAGGQTKTHLVPLNEDETATIAVAAPGMTTVTKQVTLNCENPAASIADATCADDGALVTMTNNGATSPVTFTITKNGGSPVTVNAAGGQTKTHLVPLNEDETATIAVSAPRMTTVTKQVTLNCENPAATIADVDCTDRGALVTLTNSGASAAVTFTITKNGHTITTLAVNPNQTRTHLVPVAEDETALIQVMAPGLNTVSKTVDGDCQNPVATIADASCVDDGAKVTLTNLTGQLPVTFTITKNGATPVTVDVPANDTRTHIVPLNENETATIAVSAPGMTTVTKSVTLDCINPAVASTEISCVDAGALVRLTNANATEAVTFTITKNGASAVSVPVPANGSITHVVAFAEDETATIQISAPTMTAVTQSFTLDCVQGVVIEKPLPPEVKGATLARTGAPLAGLAFTGIGFLIVGLILRFGGRRKTSKGEA